MRIGIFDSGIGGQVMAEALALLLPDSVITSVDDHVNVPYGNRSAEEITNLTDRAIQPLIKGGNDVIVIACNTATTVAIEYLRNKYPQQKFVGLEPMVKPAAKTTKTGHIAVCATRGTLHSKRYKALKDNWANNIDVIEPDCSEWAGLIEAGRQNEIDLESTVNNLISHNVDVIVLGCTHYHWLKDRISQLVGPDVIVMEPTDAIADRISAIV